MIRHLSPEQISQWAIGDRTAETEQHAKECAACREAIDRLQGSLELFRDSIRELSEARLGVGSRAAWTPPRARSFWNRPVMRWAAAAAAVVMVGAIPAYKGCEDSQRRVAAAKQDAVLLQEVDAGLSRSVPQPLESWSSLMLTGPGSVRKQQQQ